MCDYSLENLASRDAKEGDRLNLRRFESGSIGACDPNVANVPVCMLPEVTRLVVDRLSPELRREHGLRPGPVQATFVQRSLKKNEYGHRDAVRFENGQDVLLQDLGAGVEIFVLAIGAENEKKRDNLETTVRAERELVSV